MHTDEPETFDLQTAKGYPIAVKRYAPAATPKAIVLIAPATGVKQSYYRPFAEYLMATNLQVHTLDYGGIGESKRESLRQFDTSAQDWGRNDLEVAIQHCRREHPELPLRIVAHSIGGQLLGLVPSITEAERIITIASQSGYWKHWSGRGRLLMWSYWYLIFPTLIRIFGYLPARSVSRMEDLPKSMALEWRRWCQSPDYLFDHVPDAQQQYDRITVPMFSYSVSDDDYAPESAVDALSAHYRQAQLERIRLRPSDFGESRVGHFGFFKRSRVGDLWPRLLEHLS